MDLFIKNGDVLIDGAFIKTNVTIKDGKISSLSDKENAHSLPVLDAKGKKVVSGFIDIHTHGGNNVDINHATTEDLYRLSSFFASQGTTSFQTSIVTDTEENTLRCIDRIKTAMDNSKTGANILGIHLEGPFLAPDFKGSMAGHLLKKPDWELFEKYQQEADGKITYITVAPEAEGALDLIGELHRQGIVVSIGHSGADYDTAIEAVHSGAACATHIFNAMKPLHHHAPAISGAALESDIYCEAICDGRHLHPGIVRLLLKTKGLDRVIAITDSIMATGLPDGDYILGVNKIRVTGGDARLISDGTRAGSTLTTINALKNLIKFTGKKLEELIPLLTVNPASLLGIDDRKGTVAVGKDADLVILDDEINVDTTVVCGSIAYQNIE